MSEFSEFLEHVTTDGDRWDLLSLRYYGSALEYSRLHAANPGLAALPVLPGGLRLVVPIVEASDAAAALLEGLPPWKR